MLLGNAVGEWDTKSLCINCKMEEMKLTHATGRATVVVDRGIVGDRGGSALRGDLAILKQNIAHAQKMVKLKRVFGLKDKLLEALRSKQASEGVLDLASETEESDSGLEQEDSDLEQDEQEEQWQQEMAHFLEQEEEDRKRNSHRPCLCSCMSRGRAPCSHPARECPGIAEAGSPNCAECTKKWRAAVAAGEEW